VLLLLLLLFLQLLLQVFSICPLLCQLLLQVLRLLLQLCQVLLPGVVLLLQLSHLALCCSQLLLKRPAVTCGSLLQTGHLSLVPPQLQDNTATTQAGANTHRVSA
jgi:hypothetical protein